MKSAFHAYVQTMIRPKNHIRFFPILIALLLMALPRMVQAASNSITTPDTNGDVGRYAALVLDNNGNPVVSYSDDTNGRLKVLHCNDVNCAGNDESITSPDSEGVGRSTSLALDIIGNPVVSYYSNGSLKIMHCNDANCAGNDESITSPDTAGNDTRYTSLALDLGGNPVVSYYGKSADLKILHCNDANCAGNDESITAPDTAGDVGQWSSLALDKKGYPVVSYFDVTNFNLKVLHCNDDRCAGNDESISSPDTAGDVGTTTSLALDNSGNPVVSYIDVSNGSLKILLCNDANCAGNDEHFSLIPRTVTGGAAYPSLVLDPSGNPVVSYYGNAVTNGALHVLRCNDANCDTNVNGTESDVPIVTGSTGQFSSLALDSNGRPVASFYRVGGPLNLLHCGSRSCGSIDDPDHDNDGIPDDYDIDDDNDGQLDAYESLCDSNPLDSASRSPDTDNNGFPDCLDVDTDGDGLLDQWETNGLTVTVHGVAEFVNLPVMGADPKHKDIFVEIDYMVEITHTHKPQAQAIADVVTAFNNAPVANPDGTTGVHLHVDFGPDAPLTYGAAATWGSLSQSDALTHITKFGTTAGQSGYSWAMFDNVKKSYFSVGRAAVFHYNLWVHDMAPENGSTSGISRDLGASDFIASLGSWTNQVGTSKQQAGTLMHELGHNLGLHHGGQDDLQYKPNHLSVMNYSFQTRGLIINNSQDALDYSRFDLPSLNENKLDETVGITFSGTTTQTYGTYSYCPDGRMVNFPNVAKYVDWNCMNSNVDKGISADINHSTSLDTLATINEWKILVYKGGAIGQPGVQIELPATTVVNEITKQENDLIPDFVPEAGVTSVYLPLIMR